jgi:hypothetical protein
MTDSGRPMVALEGEALMMNMTNNVYLSNYSIIVQNIGY